MKRRIAQSALAFVVVILSAAACGPLSGPGEGAATDTGLAQNADGYTDISVEQLAAMLPDKDLTLVNVHIPYQGELPETDLFISYDQIAQNVDQLPGKDAPIVLYCRSGSMSTEAAEALADLGYTNILELDGGFNAWVEAGNPLLDKAR